MTKSSRSKTKQRQKEREAQRRRNRQRGIIGAVIVAAVVLLVLFIVSNLPADAPIPNDIDERYAGLQRGFTDEGFPRLGEPDAPVRVVEQSSFDCPACGTFHESIFPELLDRVRAGEISFTFVPRFGTGGIDNGEGAARAAICAGNQGQFWELHSVLFEWQTQFGNNAYTNNRLRAGAESLGLDMGEFSDCVFSGPTTEVLTNGQRVARGGTPNVAVNDSPVGSTTLPAINSAIDSALAAAGPVNQPPVAPPTDVPDAEPTAEVTQEAQEAEATQEAEDAAVPAEVTEEADATEAEMTEEAETTEEAEASAEATDQIEEPEATEEAASSP